MPHPVNRGDKFDDAVRGSRWGSAARYAVERLRRHPAELCRWRSGKRAVPFEVAAMAKHDLGLAMSFWRGGIR